MEAQREFHRDLMHRWRRDIKSELNKGSTMTDNRRSTAVMEAAEIIDAVIKTLNVDGSVCDSCGTFRRHAWEDYTLAVQLIAMSKKLRSVSQQFEVDEAQCRKQKEDQDAS